MSKTINRLIAAAAVLAVVVIVCLHVYYNSPSKNRNRIFLLTYNDSSNASAVPAISSSIVYELHKPETVTEATEAPATTDKPVKSDSNPAKKPKPTSPPKKADDPLPTENIEINIEFPLNLNTASKEELMMLPNSNEEIADKIIEFRELYQYFSHPYELAYINGLSEFQVWEMLDYVYVEFEEVLNDG